MRKLYFYVHTHWDREWYQPFETFRAQLIPIVRKVLDGLEANELPRFYLDGQSIIFDDVLEIDPSLEPRFRKVMAEGKLLAGPWYVLADQMLVGGESLIRNLKLGIEGTRRFGEPAMVGYCPDTFGHTQDLPRILRGFGIDTAVVWRGVPALKHGPVFWWQSPDESRVLAYHFTKGYYQTAFHETASTRGDGTEMQKLAESLLPWVDLAPAHNGGFHSYFKQINGALVPIGADHVGPPARLNKLVEELNALFRSNKEQVQLVPTTLPEYLAEVQRHMGKEGQLEAAVETELRSNSTAPFYERSYLLYGVLSTRLYLKRANRVAEYRLSRLSEPLFAMLSAMKLAAYPQAEFNYAWKLLMHNHPHDSICGCSVDEVHRQMMTRSEKLNSMIDCLLEQASEGVAGTFDNPSMSSKDPAFGADALAVFNTAGAKASAPIYMTWATELGAPEPKNDNIQIDSRRKVDHLFAGWGAVPYYKEVELVGGWVWGADVPPLGCKTFAWNAAEQAETPAGTGSGQAPVVSVKGTRMTNGLLDVSVSGSGRITVSHTVPGGQAKTYRLGHNFRDVADCGDTYNFDPIPADKPVAARVVSVVPAEQGPLVGAIAITYEIDLPEGAVPAEGLFTRKHPELAKLEVCKRSPKRIKHRITTRLSLKRGVGLLFFDTTWDNQASDHRLEVLFDTGDVVRHSFSENHFSLVERRHNVRGIGQKLPVPAAHEAAPDRFPCQRFFVTNGQVFLNTGLPEYGAEGTEVSITLLRAVSWLSKPRLYTRGGGAGPHVPVPEANCLGKNHASYGWAPLAVAGDPKANRLPDSAVEQAYACAEQYEGQLWATLTQNEHLSRVTGVSAAQLSARGHSLIDVENPAVRVVACLGVADGESIVLRLLNVTREPQCTRLLLPPGAFGSATVTALNGEPLGAADIKTDGEHCFVALDFGVNQLQTLLLQPRVHKRLAQDTALVTTTPAKAKKSTGGTSRGRGKKSSR